MLSKCVVAFLKICCLFQTTPVCLVSWGSQREMPWANGPNSLSSPGSGRMWVPFRGLRSAQTKHWSKMSVRWVSDQLFTAFECFLYLNSNHWRVYFSFYVNIMHSSWHSSLFSMQNFAKEFMVSDIRELEEDYIRNELKKAGGANYDAQAE